MAKIEREGIQPEFVLGSKNFFAGRWKEFKDRSFSLGSESEEASPYKYLKCSRCPSEASNVKINEEDGRPYCPICRDKLSSLVGMS